MGTLGLWGIIIIVGLIVLLYGAKRLPDMARSLGRSSREFKDALAEAPEDFKAGARDAELEADVLPDGRSEHELELERQLALERERRRRTTP